MEKVEPVAVGDVVDGLLEKIGIDRFGIQSKLLKIWTAAVGKDIALHTKPFEFKKGLLVVHVDSSPWFNELNRYYTKKIIDRLNKKLGGKEIKGIKFKIGDI